ncbi:MAG: hypothetical protein RI883_2072 [Bacteroidota bacterium]
MKLKNTHLLVVLVILSFTFSCKPKETEVEVSAGEVDATRFVSIGGLATSGFMDDALYAEGQENSLGAILSEQFKLIGGGNFNQALMPASSDGNNVLGFSRYVLNFKTDCLGVTSLSPIRSASTGDVAGFSINNYSTVSPFHNFGIPYLKSTEYNNSSITNPYYIRMASNPGSSTVKGDIMLSNSTFFTLFTGMDEVLEYAKNGASSGSLTPVNGAVGIGFDGSINDLLLDLTANGSRGAISNIPDVTTAPFFTTIPFDGLTLDTDKAQTLNDIYNPIGIFFQVGKNAFMIEDPTAGAFGVRQMVEGELILLSVPLDSLKCNKMGSVFPFRNEFVLTNSELLEIRNTISGFNTVIGSLASNYNLALVNSYSFYNQLKTGIVYNGISINAKFVSGGAYSLDGLSLNPRGTALLANEFITAINQKYQSTIPKVDATKFRGVIFP